MSDPVIHRYELMPERRFQRRRADQEPIPEDRERSSSERDDPRVKRRRLEALERNPAVRRIVPLADARRPAWIRSRTRVRSFGLIGADAFGCLGGLLVGAMLAGIGFPVLTIALAVPAGLLLARLLGLYDAENLVMRRSTLDELPRLLELSGIVAVGARLSVELGEGRRALVLMWAATFALLVIGRAAVRAATRKALPPERAIIIGDSSVAHPIVRKIGACHANLEIVGSVALRPGESAAALGGVDGIRSIVEREHLERVILAPVSADATDTLELVRVAKAAGVNVSIFPRLLEVVGSSVEIEQIDGMHMLTVRRFGLTRGARIIKRSFDLIVASVMLIVLAPLMVAICLAIRLDSRGRALFRQVRVGRDGEHFCIFKFRTMVDDAEYRKPELRPLNSAGDGFFKMDADPRITRVGALLRKTSLDELPQLFNVLRGEMSIVGPRPLIIDEDSRILGLDRARLHLTPGMTGPWQVLGSSRIPMEEMVGLDYVYVANWTLWEDIKLALRTCGYVLARGNR